MSQHGLGAYVRHWADSEASWWLSRALSSLAASSLSPAGGVTLLILHCACAMRTLGQHQHLSPYLMSSRNEP